MREGIRKCFAVGTLFTALATFIVLASLRAHALPDRLQTPLALLPAIAFLTLLLINVYRSEIPTRVWITACLLWVAFGAAFMLVVGALLNGGELGLPLLASTAVFLPMVRATADVSKPKEKGNEA